VKLNRTWKRSITKLVTAPNYRITLPCYIHAGPSSSNTDCKLSQNQHTHTLPAFKCHLKHFYFSFY